VIAACPGAGRSAILSALKKLTEENVIVKCGAGRGTYYVRSDAFGAAGPAEAIIAGGNTPLDECLSEDKVEW